MDTSRIVFALLGGGLAAVLVHIVMTSGHLLEVIMIWCLLFAYYLLGYSSGMSSGYEIRKKEEEKREQSHPAQSSLPQEEGLDGRSR